MTSSTETPIADKTRTRSVAVGTGMALGGLEIFIGLRELRSAPSTSGLLIALALVAIGAFALRAATQARRGSAQHFARNALASGLGVLVASVWFITSHSRGRFSALTLLAIGVGLASFVLSGLGVAELRKRH
ncbi:MAG: hypothetical protein QM784_13215 [Polyangiaceae bacterium]